MKRSLLFLKPFAIFLPVIFGIITTSCSKPTNADEIKVIPFSHKTHVELYDIKDCGTCHKYDANGTFRGLPSVGECTTCHKRDGGLTSVDHKSPRKKSRFDSFTDKDRPWVSKAKEPELVYYSHKVALTAPLADGKTKLRCEPCHGDKVSSSGKACLQGEKLMKQCIECHTTFKMNNQCDTCHR